MLKTTVREIYKYRPCREEAVNMMKLLFNHDCEDMNIDQMFDLLTDDQKNKEFTILEILDNFGVKLAFWALRTQDYLDYCLVLADIAESVLHLFEKKYPENKALRKCINGIRAYKNGEISKKELKSLAVSAAAAAADAAAYDAAAAAAAAYDAAAAAAYDAAVSAAVAYAAAAVSAAAVSAAAVSAAAAYADAAAYAAAKQWKKNGEILRKHLGLNQ